MEININQVSLAERYFETPEVSPVLHGGSVKTSEKSTLSKELLMLTNMFRDAVVVLAVWLFVLAASVAVASTSPLDMSMCAKEESDASCDTDPDRLRWQFNYLREVNTSGDMTNWYNDFKAVPTGIIFSNTGTSTCWTRDTANICSVGVVSAAFTYTLGTNWSFVTYNLSDPNYEFSVTFTDTKLIRGSMGIVEHQEANRVFTYRIVGWPFTTSDLRLRLIVSFGLAYDADTLVYSRNGGYLIVLNNYTQVYFSSNCLTGGSMTDTAILSYTQVKGFYNFLVDLPNATDIEYSISMALTTDASSSGSTGGNSTTASDAGSSSASEIGIVSTSSPITMELCVDGAEQCGNDSRRLQWNLLNLQEVDASGNIVRKYHEFDAATDYSFSFNHATNSSCPGNGSSVCSIEVADAVLSNSGFGENDTPDNAGVVNDNIMISCRHARLVSGVLHGFQFDFSNRLLTYGIYARNFSDTSNRLRLTFSVRLLVNGTISSRTDINHFGNSSIIYFDNAAYVFLSDTGTRVNGSTEVGVSINASSADGLITASIEFDLSDNLEYTFEIGPLSTSAGDPRTPAPAPAPIPAPAPSTGTYTPDSSAVRMKICPSGDFFRDWCPGNSSLEWSLLDFQQVTRTLDLYHTYHNFTTSGDSAFAFGNPITAPCKTPESMCTVKTAVAFFSSDGNANYGNATQAPAGSTDISIRCNNSRLLLGEYIDRAVVPKNVTRTLTYTIIQPGTMTAFCGVTFRFGLLNAGSDNSVVHQSNLNGYRFTFFTEGRNPAGEVFFSSQARSEAGNFDYNAMGERYSTENGVVTFTIYLHTFSSFSFVVGFVPPLEITPQPSPVSTPTPHPSTTPATSSAVNTGICFIGSDDELQCPSTAKLQLALLSLQEIDSLGNRVHLQYDFTTTNDNWFTFDSGTLTSCRTGNSACLVKNATGVIPNYGDGFYPNAGFLIRCNKTQLVWGVMDQAAMAPDATRELAYDFFYWNFASIYNRLRFTFRVSLPGGVNSIRSEPDNTCNNCWRLSIIDNTTHLVAADILLPRFCEWESQPAEMHYTVRNDSVDFSITCPADAYIKYRIAFAPSFTTPYPTSTAAPPGPTEPEAGTPDATDVDSGKPSTALNMFPGGFEFCVARDCNIDDGVLSFTLDQLGLNPVFTGALEFESLLSDFTQATDLNFGNLSIEDAPHHVIMKIPGIGGLAQCLDATLSAITSVRDPTATYIMLEVQRLTKAVDTPTTYDGSQTVPAGSLRVRMSILIPNDVIIEDAVGFSFLMFALQDNDTISSITRRSLVSGFKYIDVGDMYINYPRYTIIDGNYSTYSVHVKGYPYTSGENEGMIELLLKFPPFQSNITYEFFIGSNSIRYESPENSTNTTSTTATGNDLIDQSDMDNPTVAPDGKPITTKMLAFPRGAFGLAFASENGTASSALKVAFTGLEASEGVKLSRFADAAAFVFSEPEGINEGANEIWRASFTALVPQNRLRPPMPYDATLASVHPNFSVTVDQYLVPGTTLNGNQTISIPRGGLKFSFSIANWRFASATDTIVLNATLSSIIGDVPCASGLNWTDMNQVLRVWLNDDQFVDIPQLALYDGEVRRVKITPIQEESVGLVFSMTFSHFNTSVQYDPVVASQSLVAQDPVLLELLRTPLRKHLDRTVRIVLLVILAFVVVVSAVGCFKRYRYRKRSGAKLLCRRIKPASKQTRN